MSLPRVHNSAGVALGVALGVLHRLWELLCACDKINDCTVTLYLGACSLTSVYVYMSGW